MNTDFITAVLKKEKYYICNSGTDQVSIYNSRKEKLSLKKIQELNFKSIKEMESFLIKSTKQKVDRHTEETFFNILKQNLLVEEKYPPSTELCLKITKGVNYKSILVNDTAKEFALLKEIKEAQNYTFKYEDFSYPKKIPKVQAILREKKVNFVKGSRINIIPLHIKAIIPYL